MGTGFCFFTALEARIRAEKTLESIERPVDLLIEERSPELPNMMLLIALQGNYILFDL